jgi:predicted O-linked N-acetylglucosamine transferase (SPINDLY family)
VDTDRVELLGLCADPRSHLELYRRVDVALDTSPYNGTTTTCEALWMGVPVVTRRGDRHAARVGESLLSAIGQPEWVAPDWDGYRALARRLAAVATDDAPRGAILRERMRTSLLMDGPEQAKRFWRQLKKAVERP